MSGRTRFEQKDLFTLAFSEPSVVTMYLLPEFNLKLRPLLLAQMRPGSPGDLARVGHGRLAAG